MRDSDNLHREEALFDAALELAPDERGPFLARECGEDAALRQRVEALIRSHEENNGILDQATLSLAGSVACCPPVSSPEKPGDRIGRYKLLQQIGEGGCGVVYMAEQEEPVRRKVALKVIKLGMDTKQVVARFEAERQALALMDHPNIAKVLDAGATEAGRPYFVMELVCGPPLTEYCDRNRLSTVERLRLFICVCQAVQHAHQKAIIHRDLKPANVLVAQGDGGPSPKVIDFGIAKALSQRLTDKTLFTRFAQVLGTPAYMSPEQAEVGGADVDTRSDIYSLGVLLYELLVGVTPFDSDAPGDVAMEHVRRMIRDCDPPRPSTRLQMLGASAAVIADRRCTEPAALRRVVCGDLDWIVMKCLERERQRRYDTASSLALDLERYLKSEPVSAAAPSAVYRAGKFVSRHKAGLASASAVVLLLIAGIFGSTWQAVRATHAERKALAEAGKSRRVAQLLRDTLNGLGPPLAKGLDTTLVRQILDQSAERLSQDWEGQPEVEVELRNTMGDICVNLGQFAMAEVMYGRALAITTNLAGRHDEQTADQWKILASALYEQGKQDPAGAALLRALALYRAQFGPKHQKIALALSDLASVREMQGAYPQAESLNRAALAMKLEVFGKESLEVSDSQCDLSNLLRREGQYAEAESYARQCLVVRQKVLGANHRRVANSWDDLASLQFQQHKVVEAEASEKRAMALHWRILNEAHPEVADRLGRLAVMLWRGGELAEAEEALRQLIKLRGQWPDTNRPSAQVSDLVNLADVLADQGRLREAEQLLNDSLNPGRQTFGDDHPDIASCRSELAVILALEGKLVEAEEEYLQALSLWAGKSPERWEKFLAEIQLAAILFPQHQELRAEPLLISGFQGLAAQRQMLSQLASWRISSALRRVADFYDAAGSASQAQEWRKRSSEFQASNL